MRSLSKGRSQRWTAQLDPERVREAFDEAILDCYGEYEQHSGLLTMIEQEVKFPFQAQVLGDRVKIVGMEWPDDEEFGLDFVCERKGKPHRVEARSVELISPFPAGHLYIAAYLDWKKHL